MMKIGAWPEVAAALAMDLPQQQALYCHGPIVATFPDMQQIHPGMVISS